MCHDPASCLLLAMFVFCEGGLAVTQVWSSGKGRTFKTLERCHLPLTDKNWGIKI